jgi:hypothetical protein
VRSHSARTMRSRISSMTVGCSPQCRRSAGFPFPCPGSSRRAGRSLRR